MPHPDALPAPVPLPHFQRLMLVLSRGACRGTHGQNALYQVDSRGADEGRVVIGHVDETTIIQTRAGGGLTPLRICSKGRRMRILRGWPTCVRIGQESLATAGKR